MTEVGKGEDAYEENRNKKKTELEFPICCIFFGASKLLAICISRMLRCYWTHSMSLGCLFRSTCADERNSSIGLLSFNIIPKQEPKNLRIVWFSGSLRMNVMKISLPAQARKQPKLVRFRRYSSAPWHLGTVLMATEAVFGGQESFRKVSNIIWAKVWPWAGFRWLALGFAR